MVILRFILNSAGVWWLFGGLFGLGAIAHHMTGMRPVLLVLSIVWLLGIVPACVLSAQSSNNPANDLRAAWHATKSYLFALSIVFGGGLALAGVILLSRI